MRVYKKSWITLPCDNQIPKSATFFSVPTDNIRPFGDHDELKLSLVKMKEHKGDDFQGRSYLNREQEKGTKFLGAD